MQALAFGGAFNPPTQAHIELAQWAMQQLSAQRVIFIPSKQVYISDTEGKDFAFTDQQRLAMLKQISANRPWMEVCDYELQADHQPRTYETLCYLRRCGWQCRLLMGSDKLSELETGWRHVPEIGREFGIAVLQRGHEDAAAQIAGDPYLHSLQPYLTVLKTPAAYRSVSSTKVRKKFRQIQQDLARLDRMLPAELDGLRPYLTKGKGE